MRRRIGNDIPVEVEILRNGKAEDMDLLQSFDIQIKSRNGAVMPFEYLLEGNKAKGTFYGKDQLETGPYLIVLVENGGLNGMATVDAELVTLVDRTYKENIDDEDATVCVSFSVVTDGEYVSAHFSAVRDGLSAYEIAVLNGFAGTVEEWLESLKGPQGPQGDKMTYADLTQEDKEDIYAGGAQILKPLLDAKANLQHQHTVADITDFPELYYDATAFFASAYPSDRYEELLEAVKAKKTVYATIDEAGYVSYIFFVSSANSDGSSSRVLLTTIFADGGYLYINTFVLQQSGMTTLQESITGKADKATTLAGYGIGDAYTKSELDALLKGKQNTLTAGNGISIEGNVIGVTAITESESQPNTSLWLNPSEDEETDVTYNRSQIDAMVGAKQDTLQLTIKDNGNIVLSNIQGQSKEFMPATPSGDPMHYAYEAAGAVWNGTGADIIKDAPWAELADDDAEKKVVHKAGYWYLNGLGDLTNADMRLVYFTPIFNGGFSEGMYYNTLARTVVCSKTIASSFVRASWRTLCRNGKIEILGNNLAYNVNVYDSMIYSFAFTQMKAILYTINLSTTKISSEYSPFSNISQLRYIKLKGLNNSLSIEHSSFLTCKSILYMINNEAATSAITIFLHADAYARAMANSDILAALEAHPNVSLASV